MWRWQAAGEGTQPDEYAEAEAAEEHDEVSILVGNSIEPSQLCLRHDCR